MTKEPGFEIRQTNRTEYVVRIREGLTSETLKGYLENVPDDAVITAMVYQDEECELFCLLFRRSG